MKNTPKRMKWLLNLYPPYRGAGVKIEHISPDWQEMRVSMSLHWYNRNYFGTHFGGNLYSMVDPHLVLLLAQRLGKAYLVWDNAATIEFVRASKGRVTAVIQIPDAALADINQQTANGKKYLPQFTIEIRDEIGDLVATVEKTLYIRKKQHKIENLT